MSLTWALGRVSFPQKEEQGGECRKPKEKQGLGRKETFGWTQGYVPEPQQCRFLVQSGQRLRSVRGGLPLGMCKRTCAGQEGRRACSPIGTSTSRAHGSSDLGRCPPGWSDFSVCPSHTLGTCGISIHTSATRGGVEIRYKCGERSNDGQRESTCVKRRTGAERAGRRKTYE